MFDKVLVANRGEIACRIIATLRQHGRALGRGLLRRRRGNAPRAPRRRGGAHRARAGRRELPRRARGDQRRARARRAGDPPRLRLPRRARRLRRAGARPPGLTFIGPTPEQLRVFGAKHTAREQAEAAGVPLLPGHRDRDDGRRRAARRPRPSATRSCSRRPPAAAASACGCARTPTQLADSVRGREPASRRRVRRRAGVPRALARRRAPRRGADRRRRRRAGSSRSATATARRSGGTRRCSRRRPRPGSPDALRARMLRAAEQLAASVSYRSAGTVEFLVDVATDTVAFLEVNARLQVEHTVTEAVWGVDLVEWMVRIAAGDASVLDAPLTPRGHAIEARVCAENPWRGHEPSAGTLSSVSFPADVRVDTWVEAGTRGHRQLRLAARQGRRARRNARRGAATALRARARRDRASRASTTNLDLLRAALVRSRLRRSRALSTSLLDGCPTGRPRDRGAHRRDDDHRAGPSGPARLLGGRRAAERPDGRPARSASGTAIVGNAEGTPGLELTAQGPRLLFHTDGDGVPRRRAERGRPSTGARSRCGSRSTIAAGATVTVDAIGPPGTARLPARAGRHRRVPRARERVDVHARRVRRLRGTRAAHRRRVAPRPTRPGTGAR